MVIEGGESINIASGAGSYNGSSVVISSPSSPNTRVYDCKINRVTRDPNPLIQILYFNLLSSLGVLWVWEAGVSVCW